jgi:hypothetical protein
MQPKPRYVAKYKTKRGERFLLSILKDYRLPSSLRLAPQRCAPGLYDKSELPVVSEPGSLSEGIGRSFQLSRLAALYREGKVTEDAVTIAMEILLIVSHFSNLF